MQKIIGIYNANGSLLGEMRYVFDKIFFKKHCALCDITHGMSYKAKSTWLEQVERFPIPIETLHLDEISDDIRQVVADKVPCLVMVEGDSINIVMSTEELQACDSDPHLFFKRLRVNVDEV